jgi:hypothetical protein
MMMRSDRASDLGWTNEVREALRRPNHAGPLSTRRTWRDSVRLGMMRATVVAGVLTGLVMLGLALAGFAR